MKLFKIFIILFLIFGCSNQNPTDERISVFEEKLGVKETNALNLLVSDFEKKLIKIYPDLTIEKGYRQYLTDIVSDSTTDWNKFKFQSDKTNSEFHKSGLWNEIYTSSKTYDRITNDSVDALRYNSVGKYMRALYQIKDSDSLVKVYSEIRQAAGMMPNELFVSGILSSNPDFTDYFHKRIVVLEFSF